MDNPTTTLFQGSEIKINNSQNNEEEEDIEDQKRRKEELQNLLTAALDDFNYDESTVNSSTNISVASFDEMQQNYRQASQPNEQLKVLYDVRVRELTNLRKEYSDYKAETSKDIKLLKNKLLLSEAEMRQLQISLKNVEDLLVEKTSDIKELKDLLNSKDVQLKNYEKIVENYKIEVCTYQSTVNELQMKLTDAGPFSVAAKRFNSEELQKAHQDQVTRLESLLNEQTKIAGILEKEKISLQQDLDRVIKHKIESENEGTIAIKALTRTLEDAQNQCKSLLDVVEMLTNENHHLQERLNDTNIVEDNKTETLDYSVVLAHNEKLKKMLLDKSIHIDTLNAKLKNYENDIKELIEYRQVKCDIYKKEFQQCENKDHIKSLIVMQNDLQNYRRIIEDKTQQILTLNTTNRDLQEKIEEMLLQTRNDIQNLSHKYSLPQLEQMTEELKNAEDRVKELQVKLEKSEERRLSLVQKLQKNENQIDKDLKKELDAQIIITKNSERDNCNLENQIKLLQKDLNISLSEIKKLKDFSDDLMKENAKLKSDLKEARQQIETLHRSTSENTERMSHTVHGTDTVKNEYEELKEQLNQVMAHLQKNKMQKDNPEIITNLEIEMDKFFLSLNENDLKLLLENHIKRWKQQLDIIKTMLGADGDQNTQAQLKETLQELQESRHKIKSLEDALEDLTSAKTIAEGEKCSYQFKVRDCEDQLDHAFKTIKYLEIEVQDLTNKLKEKEAIIDQLQNNEAKEELEKVKEELLYKQNILQMCDEHKNELNDLLHKTKSQLEESKKEILTLQSKITEMSEKAVRRNLEIELKEAENQLEQSRIEERGDYENDEYFQKCLQAEMLKNELKLREDLQLEYLKKMRDIERKYKKACSATNELYEAQLEKMKNQEIQYREHLAKILAECAKKISEFENEKQSLRSQLKSIQAEHTDFKNQIFAREANYKKLIEQMQMDAEKKVEGWKNWSREFASKCLNIDMINKKSRDNILLGMKNVDAEIAVIEKTYKEKIKKYLKSGKS